MEGWLDWMVHDDGRGVEGESYGTVTHWQSLKRRSKTATKGDRQAERKRRRSSPRSPPQSGSSRYSAPLPCSFPPQPWSHAALGAVRNELMLLAEWMEGVGRGRAGKTDTERGREGKGAFCLVISSRSLPSGAVVRWLAGRPEGPRACAGPLIRRHSGPGCHLGYSDRSS